MVDYAQEQVGFDHRAVAAAVAPFIQGYSDALKSEFPEFADKSKARTRTYYLFADRDLVLVRGMGMGKVRIAFEGKELVVTPVEGSGIDRAQRFRRAL